MKIRHVFGALTVTVITYGMTAGVSVVRAQDHHDPYLANTSPEAVQQSSPEAVQQSSPEAVKQSSPEAVQPVVVEQTSPRAETVQKHTPRDPYILTTSPKTHKVKQAKACKTETPKQAKTTTIVGCFYREVDSDGDHAKYMLADMTMGPATTVPDQNCTPSGGQLIRIKDADDVGLNQVASNRWVELYGKLGSNHDADDPRKFEVKSFREVPLAQRPRIAIIIPPAPPAPQAAVETPPELEQAVTESPKPMATTGETPYERKLPKTASELPLIALLGLFALTGGLVLGLVDRQKVHGRG